MGLRLWTPLGASRTLWIVALGFCLFARRSDSRDPARSICRPSRLRAPLPGQRVLPLPATRLRPGSCSFLPCGGAFCAVHGNPRNLTNPLRGAWNRIEARRCAWDSNRLRALQFHRRGRCICHRTSRRLLLRASCIPRIRPDREYRFQRSSTPPQTKSNQESRNAGRRIKDALTPQQMVC